MYIFYTYSTSKYISYTNICIHILLIRIQILQMYESPGVTPSATPQEYIYIHNTYIHIKCVYTYTYYTYMYISYVYILLHVHIIFMYIRIVSIYVYKSYINQYTYRCRLARRLVHVHLKQYEKDILTTTQQHT